ncbi:MAG TPA: hypothetical protein ENJ45_00755 [Phaeodactylibacter sp.]|nr:hypothetical protein [Phaeodactylibacter sp.]
MQRLFLLLLFLLPSFCFAQQITISEELSIRNDQQYFLLGKLKDRFLVFRDKHNEYLVQAYDMNMRLSWEKEIELEGKRIDLLDLVSFDDHFYLFYLYRKKGNYFLKMNRYNAGATLVDSTTVWHYKDNPYSPKPQLLFSEDDKKVLVYELIRQTDYKVFAYDIENKARLWDMKFEPAKFNAYRDLYQWVINNKGEAFFAVGLDNRKARKESHRYEIYHCRAGMDKPIIAKVEMQGKLTYDIHFSYDNKNHRLLAAGLYSEKNRGKTNGAFFFLLPDMAHDNSQVSFLSFDLEFMSQIMETKNPNIKGLDNVSIKELILRQDGGVLLVAELAKQYERRMAATNRGYIGRDGSRYIVDYYNDDIFVVSIHPNGQLHWKSILHKKQFSQDDNAVFSSFYLMKTPSTLRFLFNDDIKRENTVSEYVMNGYGEFDRNSVMSTQSQNIQLRFQDAVQFGPADIIVPSERRHRLRLVKIEF